jgi:hypothetical protein
VTVSEILTDPSTLEYSTKRPNDQVGLEVSSGSLRPGTLREPVALKLMVGSSSARNWRC